jgi:hypothetical protein
VAFPTFLDWAVGHAGTTARSGHTIPFPARARSGDLMVIVTGQSHASSTFGTQTWPSGWTVTGLSQASNVRQEVGWKVLASTDLDDGWVRITLSVARYLDWTVMVFRNHGSDVAVAQVGGTSTSMNPPNLTPSWGSADNYWLAGACYFQGQRFTTGTPSGYGNTLGPIRWDNSNAGGIILMSKTATAASDDPSTYTLSTSQAWVACTIAVKPGSTGGVELSTPYPKVRGTSALAESTGNLVFPELPRGWQPGDLHIMAIETANEPNGVAVATPTGWSSLGNWGNTNVGAAGGTSSTRLTLFGRTAQAGDTAPTVTDPGDHAIGAIIGIFDANPAGYIDAATETTDTDFDTSISIPGVTTLVDESLVLIIGAHGVDIAQAYGVYADNWSNGVLANQRLLFDMMSPIGNGGGLFAFVGEKATAGASGTTTATGVSNHAKVYASLSIPPFAVSQQSFHAGIID